MTSTSVLGTVGTSASALTFDTDYHTTLAEHNSRFYTDSLTPTSRAVTKDAERRIRVLRIHPGDLSDGIRCDLLTVKLDDQAKYVALSYTWGDAKHHKSIEVNGQDDFWVTENAFDAIRWIRNWSTELRIWVDAICINQSDLKERNAQVTMMGNIYSAADHVTVWLGICRNLSNDKCHSWTRHEGFKQDLLQTQGDTRIPEYLVPFPARSRAWWNRCWTFQEVLLAKEIVLLIGPHRFDAQQTAYFANAKGDMNEVRLTEHLNRVMKLRQRPQSRQLVQLLSATRECYASNPRDKIFSLMSLALKEERAQIPIDYSLSTHEVILAAARVIAATSILDSFFLFNWPHLDSPSWLPDFSKTESRNAIQWRGNRWDVEYIVRRLGNEQQTSDKLSPNFAALSGLAVRSKAVNEALHIWGIRVDSIAHLAVKEQLSKMEIEGHARFGQVFLKTCASHATLASLEQKDTIDKILADVRVTSAFRRKMTGSRSSIVPSSHFAKSRIWKDGLWRTYPLAGFLTTKGYVGLLNQHPLAPEFKLITREVCSGDVIAVLLGGRCAVVLRPAPEEPGSYRLMTDAWLPSIDNGELFEALQVGKVHAEEFRVV